MSNYVSFDVLPPQNEAAGRGGQLLEDVNGTYHVSENGALWESSEPPSRQQCIDRIATHAQAEIAADAGTQFCYRTPGGRVAFIRILNIQPGDGFITSPRFEAEVTVWRK